jgi:predicted helicase
MFDDNDNFNKILFSDQRILFMSATPRVYELEYEDVEYDIESIFGKVVYNITFTEAIKNKYITAIFVAFSGLLKIEKSGTDRMNKKKFINVGIFIKDRLT